GGEAGVGGFGAELGAALTAKRFVGEKAWGVLFMVPDEGWRQLVDSLVVGRKGIPTPRYLYVTDKRYRAKVWPMADGFTLHFMDEGLREVVGGDLPDDVEDVLVLRQKGGDEPDGMAFGYVAMHEGSCVAWSMIDCIVDGHGDIGVQTELAYRQKGLGMAVSGATIAYGVAHGVPVVHWDVISFNKPSIGMAEKHGLRRELVYDQNLIVYDEMSYVANLAWHHMDKGEFEEVLGVAEALVMMEKGAKHAHFLSAAAWAGLGDVAKCVGYMHKAIDCGWDSVTEVAHCEPLQAVAETEAWAEVAVRLEG
ncbi:MAG TPA: GNAT family N-acetyltransferase, partial [Anaerolineae bacterium]|nr:GNAT family N-acetyltransferase [Anaerolineae bacterium]